MSQYTSNWAREHAFKAECVEAGRECLSAREAALLFGVEPATLRMAKKAGNIRPVFVMTFGRGDIPFYRLSDLIKHFHRTGLSRTARQDAPERKHVLDAIGLAGRLAAAVRSAWTAAVGR